MCHCLASQSDSSMLVTYLTCTRRTIDSDGGGDIIRTPLEEVGDEGEDKSIVVGAQSQQPFLVVLWTLGWEKFILSGW